MHLCRRPTMWLCVCCYRTHWSLFKYSSSSFMSNINVEHTFLDPIRVLCAWSFSRRSLPIDVGRRVTITFCAKQIRLSDRVFDRVDANEIVLHTTKHHNENWALAGHSIWNGANTTIALSTFSQRTNTAGERSGTKSHRKHIFSINLQSTQLIIIQRYTPRLVRPAVFLIFRSFLFCAPIRWRAVEATTAAAAHKQECKMISV